MADVTPARILIADDEPLFLRTTAQLLSKGGYECVTAPDGTTAIEELMRGPFDLLLSDLNMPGNFKLELLHEGRARWPTMPLIVITGAPSLPTAIESVRLGIADYLLKPVKYEDLLSSVRRTLAHSRRPQNQGEKRGGERLPRMVGESLPIRELQDIIERVAATDANILITGESGTGKEVVAGAIHALSLRAAGPFQIVDCTAVPETLFESVLFGHAKGSFTGAIKDQVGLLSQADGGTAFFDEIGELPLPLQAKLLRVIQEQTFTPLGKAGAERIDTRFICATNRDLELEVQAGRFRRDLFYRLAVIPIELPPLRARGEDVILLAKHFLEQLRKPANHNAAFSDEALNLLRHYSWPGNIRELRNVVEHALAVARSSTIAASDLPPALRRELAAVATTGIADIQNANSSAGSREDAIESAEKSYLSTLLKDNGGNVAASARQAKVSRQSLHKLLKKHGIEPKDYRG